MKEIIENILLNPEVRGKQVSLEQMALTEEFSPWQAS